jgi:anti-sigma factor RsiW
MDEHLVAYALNALDPSERAAVEAHLATHPADAEKLARLRRALRPLEADRDSYSPPSGLAAVTVARTAEYALAHRLVELPHEPAGPPTPATLRAAGIEPVFPGLGWRRVDLAVAAGVGFLAVGLLIAGIGKVRQESQVRGCQNTLREFHTALVGYGATHGGRLPRVGSDEVPVAGAFADELARAGQLPAGGLTPCPATGSSPPPARFTPGPDVVPAVGYAYTLGYQRPDGTVVGVRLAEGANATQDGLPILADLPVTGGRPHARGLNVLYAGGAVRFCTTPAAGINGDDIYHNVVGQVRAGLHRHDASLGGPADVP